MKTFFKPIIISKHYIFSGKKIEEVKPLVYIKYKMLCVLFFVDFKHFTLRLLGRFLSILSEIVSIEAIHARFVIDVCVSVCVSV